MIDKDLEVRVFEVREPLEKPPLIGMGRESSEGVDVGLDCDLLSKEPDRLRSIDEPPSDGSFCLVADDHDVR